jgi:hypothetical protein
MNEKKIIIISVNICIRNKYTKKKKKKRSKQEATKMFSLLNEIKIFCLVGKCLNGRKEHAFFSFIVFNELFSIK